MAIAQHTTAAFHLKYHFAFMAPTTGVIFMKGGDMSAVASDGEAIRHYCRACREAGNILREVGYHVRSGLCRLDDQEILLVESELAPDVQVDLLLGALAGRDLSGIPLSEEAMGMLRAGSPG